MMKCPHCDGKAIIRSSEYMSPLVRKLVFIYRNGNRDGNGGTERLPES